MFSEEKLVGEIILDSVQEERSKATYSGAAEVRAGWKFRKFKLRELSWSSVRIHMPARWGMKAPRRRHSWL